MVLHMTLCVVYEMSYLSYTQGTFAWETDRIQVMLSKKLDPPKIQQGHGILFRVHRVREVPALAFYGQNEN